VQALVPKGIVSSLLCLLLSPAAEAARQELSLSGAGWALWHDRSADVSRDKLALPPVDLSTLTVAEPTGGWAVLESSQALRVSVPGTAEQYLQKTPGPAGDITGVTWWSRRIEVPAFEGRKRALLRFAAVRQRAEVFVDGRLVASDLIGNSPFEVDLGEGLRPGQVLRLAVRITDVGGNFDWRDGNTYSWSEYTLAGSHGFGGITGDVALVLADPVRIADLAVLNTPEPRTVRVRAELTNTEKTRVTRDLECAVLTEKDGAEVARAGRKGLVLEAGETRLVELELQAPAAELWDLHSPVLHRCVVRLNGGDGREDSTTRRFGFRWFGVDGIGRDAVFRLNGRRIMLRTAISWGFWPVSGLVPTAEQAEREVRVAKAYGQNMLNFHRCIGQPAVLDKADELGLLIYEEPGNWKSGDKDDFARAMVNEKLARMVRRDRSHPSLVIYNLINEDGKAEGENLEAREAAVRRVHELDPSRAVTRTSGWAKSGIAVEDPIKMHMRPWDPVLYQAGWFDFHHAGGPATWHQGLYKGPGEHYNRSTNREELVFWGEEGALSTPPRLGMIRDELLRRGETGWDGKAYLEHYRLFEEFIARKGLAKAFPSVDALTGALGNVSLDHQGRKIQLMRATDVADAYAVNGWESELIENHSGIVDCFRFPKGDPALMARYNAPLYVAVLPRTQVGSPGSTAKVDLYVVNEVGLSGPHRLEAEMLGADGAVLSRTVRDVIIAGGDTQGQLLVEGLELPLGSKEGFATVRAKLVDAAGEEKAKGADGLLCVDWRAAKVSGKGAIYGLNPGLARFLRKDLGLEAPNYADDLGRLDWIVVARSPGADQLNLLPEEQLSRETGGLAGISVSIAQAKTPDLAVVSRVDRTVDIDIPEGASPDPSFPGIEDYRVRWTGFIAPTQTGVHAFAVAAGGGGVRLEVDGKVLIDGLRVKGRQASDRVELALEAGRPVRLSLEFAHMRGSGRCRLYWAVPDVAPISLRRLLERVRDDGTRLVIVDHAEDWMEHLTAYSKINYTGSVKVGSAWLGGVHFARSHPLLEGLPVNDALGWPWQAVVAEGRERKLLLLEGEELAVGAWHCNEEKTPMSLGTAVGVIPCGRGRVVFSTLAIADQVGEPAGPADVARRLLCNYLSVPLAEAR